MGVNKSKGAVDVGEKKLYVNLLGEFSVWYGDKKVYMGRTSTGRQAQLFQLLMISPGFQISKEKLMADIYKSGEFNNRNNSVNNAIYRLRKMLTDAGVPGDEYIAIENGNCVWKEDIPVQVDTVEFKRLLEESRDAEDDDKLHILQEAGFSTEDRCLPAIPLKNGLFLRIFIIKNCIVTVPTRSRIY